MGIIAEIVLGGIVMIGTLIGLLCFILHRREQRRRLKLSDIEEHNRGYTLPQAKVYRAPRVLIDNEIGEGLPGDESMDRLPMTPGGTKQNA